MNNKTITIKNTYNINFTNYFNWKPSLFPYPSLQEISIHEKSTESLKRFRQGVKLLIKGYLNKCRENIYNNEEQFPAEDLKNVVSMFSRCVNAVLSRDESQARNLQEIFQLSDETMNVFYATSQELFEEEEYQDAADTLFALNLLDPLNHTYWLALGIAEQKLYNYTTALQSFAMASLLDIEAHLPHMYAAQCFFNMNKRYQARLALKMAMDIVDEESNEMKQINDFMNRL